MKPLYKEQFAAADVDADGKICLEEFHKMQASIGAARKMMKAMSE